MAIMPLPEIVSAAANWLAPDAGPIQTMVFPLIAIAPPSTTVPGSSKVTTSTPVIRRSMACGIVLTIALSRTLFIEANDPTVDHGWRSLVPRGTDNDLSKALQRQWREPA